MKSTLVSFSVIQGEFDFLVIGNNLFQLLGLKFDNGRQNILFPMENEVSTIPVQVYSIVPETARAFNHCYTTTPAGSPLCRIQVHGQTITALVDTVSNISMVHPNACKHVNSSEPLTNALHIYGANTGKLETSGSIILTLSFANVSLPHTFVISTIYSVNMILGDDFLRKYNACLTMHEWKMRLHHQNKVCDVSLIDSTKLTSQKEEEISVGQVRSIGSSSDQIRLCGPPYLIVHGHQRNNQRTVE